MLPLSEKELQARQAREAEDSKRKLDKTVPGGLTINDAGFYQNADGQYVDENGKYVNEPVAAADVQKRLEATRQAVADAEAERVRIEAERRAEADRRAAELAQQQAERTEAEAKQVKAPAEKK